MGPMYIDGVLVMALSLATGRMTTTPASTRCFHGGADARFVGDDIVARDGIARHTLPSLGRDDGRSARLQPSGAPRCSWSPPSP